MIEILEKEKYIRKRGFTEKEEARHKYQEIEKK